jgi:hypothetical protein
MNTINYNFPENIGGVRLYIELVGENDWYNKQWKQSP